MVTVIPAPTVQLIVGYCSHIDGVDALSRKREGEGEVTAVLSCRRPEPIAGRTGHAMSREIT